jgi:hypothetical protein
MRRYIIREREREEGGRKWGSSDVQRRVRKNLPENKVQKKKRHKPEWR